MKKNFVIITVLCCIFLFCNFFVRGQENRYYIQYNRLQYDTDKKGACDGDFYSVVWLYINTPNSSSIYELPSGYSISKEVFTYSVNRKPLSFRLFGRVGTREHGDDGVGPDDCAYTEGMSPFELYIDGSNYHVGCTRYLTVKYKVTIDDPAIISGVYFGSTSGTLNSCDSNEKITVKVESYYSNGKGNAEIQVLDRSSNWQTIGTIASNSTQSLTYDKIKQHVDRNSPIKIRTRKKLLDDSYSYSTFANSLYYLHQFQFPVGKTLIVEKPVCKGDSTTIKIPYTGNVGYTVTIKKPGEAGNGKNYEILDCLQEMINGTSYRCIKEKLSAGTYDLIIEYKEGQGTPCPFQKSVTVPDIPDFTISNVSYPSQVDEYKIPTIGGTGQVYFTVSNSCNRALTISAGQYTFNKTLPSTTQAYYSGNVSIDLPRGTYAIYVTNSSGCRSNTISNVVMNEPPAITFAFNGYDPKCHNEKGRYKISNIKGGIGTYKYRLDNGLFNSFNAESVEDTGVLPGQHIIMIEDKYGNKATKNFTVAPAPSAVTISTNITPPSIFGNSDGSVTITASGGTKRTGRNGYLYKKDNGTYQMSHVLSGFKSGNHIVYVMDSNECVFDFNITIPDGRKISIAKSTITAPTCNGGSDGACTLIIGNLQGSLSVSSTSGVLIPQISRDTIVFSDLPAGNYECKIKETYNKGNYEIAHTIVIPEKPRIIAHTAVTRVSNKGTASGKINVNISSGNGGTYRVELYDGNTMLQEQNCDNNCMFSGLSGEYENGGKIYKLLIYDSKGCSLETQVRVQEPQTKLTLIPEIISHVSCYGKSDAAFNIIASGGWDNKYMYSADSVKWISEKPTFTAMGAGDYKYFVRDGIGGTASVTVTITQPAPLRIDSLKIIPATCHNTATGEILLRLSGGTYPYTFINSQNIIREIIYRRDTLANVLGLLAGNYNFLLKDNHNCMAEISGINVTQPEQLRITATDIIQPTCGNDNGKLTVYGTGGTAPYTFKFINNISNNILQTKKSSNTATFENIANGTYRLVITDNNGCTTNSDILTFNEYIMPVVSDATKTDAICYAESNGQIHSIAREGTARIAYFTLINTQDSANRQSENGIFENIYAGNYLIYAYDTNGCMSNPCLVEINQPDSLILNILGVANVINKGANDGQITFSVSGGNSGKLCAWLQNENRQTADSMFIISGSTNTFNAFAGTYTLKASDTKGCIFITDTLQVVEPDMELHLTVVETIDALCKSQTGKITVEGAGGWGGYRYKYADNEQFSTLNSFGNLSSGTYHITVIDRMGATASKYITVNEPQDSLKTEVIAIRNPTCGNNNGELSINIFGGTAPYRIFAQNNRDTLYIDSAQTVVWKNAGMGALLMHALDANGCKFEQETVIPEDSLLKIEKIERGENSLTAIISGGTSPYSYMWKRTDGDETFEDTPQIDYIPDGIYRLTVTDSNGCTAEERIVFYSNNPLTLKVIQKQDETSLNARNGYAVLYSAFGLSKFDIIKPNDSIISYNSEQTTNDFKINNDTVYISNLESGKWIVKGVSKNGRITIAEFEILLYKKFEFGKTEIINVSTSDSTDGFVYINVVGGGGENIFIWTDKDGNNVRSINDEYSTTLYNVSAGVYTLTVTDKYGNMLSTEIKILAPDLPLRISVYEQKDQTCNGDKNAYVILSSAGGWGEYRYAHSRTAQSDSLKYGKDEIYTGLETGKHWFFVLDKYGVTSSVEVLIKEPLPLTASISHIQNVKCNGGNDGHVSFDIYGGTPYYKLKEIKTAFWITENNVINLSAGEYAFVFTDNFGCFADTIDVTITEPEPLSVKDISVQHTLCGEDNGKIAVALEGGTAPYYYEWKDVLGNITGIDSVIEKLKQNAAYRLIVTDNNGCVKNMQQFINGSRSPKIKEVTVRDVLCYGDSTGMAHITTVEAGMPYAPVSFIWSNGYSGDYCTNLHCGQYNIIVSDTNNCTTIYYFDVRQPDSLYLRFSDYREPHCYGYSDGYIHTQTYGGAGENTYIWNTKATTANIENITKGNYSVRVTDKNGCACEQHITINEPSEKIIDLGDDVLMCPG
ncbi:MAG: SprB repeat-containing protein, partial [Bacteroidales bacterium]|nr:SprB repeat-containing protein [Bacteroidales bacterium]